MFVFVLSFYLHSKAVKDGCSTLTVECKASAVVELSFRKGRVQTISKRALKARFYANRAPQASFSCSKEHFISPLSNKHSFKDTIVILLC